MLAQLIHQLTLQLLPVCKELELACQEAWWIVEAATQKNKIELLTQEAKLLDPKTITLIEMMVHQRVHEAKPLQYILGTVPFCELTITVAPPILIPRPETEEWVTWLCDLYTTVKVTNFTALDLCTGSGCIALALAKNFPKASLLGCDINSQAIDLANRNRTSNKITNCTFQLSDLYQALPADFTCDLIVSNPPYLSLNEYETLAHEVRAWEDQKAFVGGQDGMSFYVAILQQARHFLRPTKNNTLPNIILEIGPAQEDSLEKLLKTMGISSYIIHKDLQGKKRWVSMRYPTKQ